MTDGPCFSNAPFDDPLSEGNLSVYVGSSSPPALASHVKGDWLGDWTLFEPQCLRVWRDQNNLWPRLGQLRCGAVGWEDLDGIRNRRGCECNVIRTTCGRGLANRRRGPCPLAGRQGVEPRFAGPEPAVLPLNDLPARSAGRCGGREMLHAPNDSVKPRIPCDNRQHAARGLRVSGLPATVRFRARRGLRGPFHPLPP